MIVYYHTEFGIAIDEYRSLCAARKGIQREIGTIHSIYEIREATIEDIAWVKAMNGTLPEKALEMLKKG